MHGQRAESIETRKWDVQEETDALGHAQGAQPASERDQVIVVHPDQIIRAQQSCGVFGESLVDLQVGRVVLFGVVQDLQEVMAQRPQRTIAESQVELFVLELSQVERGVRQPLAAQHLNRAGLAFGDLSGPADPQATMGAHGREHGHRQTARRGALARHTDPI